MRLMLRSLIFTSLALFFAACEADRELNYGHRRRHLFIRQGRSQFSPLDTLNVSEAVVNDLENARYRKLNLRYYTAKSWQSQMSNSAVMDRLAQYRVRPGSTFEIKVLEESEISGRYTVGPDGCISISLIKEPLQIKDLTYDEIRLLIEERLKAFIRNPQVNINAVLVKNQDSDTFLGGEVYVFGNSGEKEGIAGQVAPIGGKTPFYKFMAGIGGVKGASDMQNIVVFRQIEGEVNVIMCDLQRLQFGDFSQNIDIVDGDLIFIPTRENNFGEQFWYEWNTILGFMGGMITWDFALEQFNSHSWKYFGF